MCSATTQPGFGDAEDFRWRDYQDRQQETEQVDRLKMWTLNEAQNHLVTHTYDTTASPPVLHVTMYVGHPPILGDEEYIGDLLVSSKTDTDRLYYELYGRWPE